MNETGNIDELKPCPFCGSGDVEIEYLDKEFHDHYMFVRCKSCEASSAIYFTRKRAIAAWNRRVRVIRGITAKVEAKTAPKAVPAPTKE